MTEVLEQIAETVVYDIDDDDEYDDDDIEEGNGTTTSTNNNGSEEDDEDQKKEQIIETKYEKYRDDQMNTGVIAALVGGFALTNSWEINMNSDGNGNEISTVELTSYTLAILAVHGCTCSALVSAFLYRSITRVKSPKAGVQWVERHPVLVQLPWYKVRLVFYVSSCYLKLLLTYCSFRRNSFRSLIISFSYYILYLHYILYSILFYSFCLVQHHMLLVLC
jgi:hypothetical protein